MEKIMNATTTTSHYSSPQTFGRLFIHPAEGRGQTFLQNPKESVALNVAAVGYPYILRDNGIPKGSDTLATWAVMRCCCAQRSGWQSCPAR